jgi:hypothetical protein
MTEQESPIMTTNPSKRKQLPRTNWEVTITAPDGTTETRARRLTTLSLTNWVDQIISDLGLGMNAYRTRIQVWAVLDDGTHRHIASY